MNLIGSMVKVKEASESLVLDYLSHSFTVEKITTRPQLIMSRGVVERNYVTPLKPDGEVSTIFPIIVFEYIDGKSEIALVEMPLDGKVFTIDTDSLGHRYIEVDLRKSRGPVVRFYVGTDSFYITHSLYSASAHYIDNGISVFTYTGFTERHPNSDLLDTLFDDIFVYDIQLA